MLLGCYVSTSLSSSSFREAAVVLYFPQALQQRGQGGCRTTMHRPWCIILPPPPWLLCPHVSHLTPSLRVSPQPRHYNVPSLPFPLIAPTYSLSLPRYSCTDRMRKKEKWATWFEKGNKYVTNYCTCLHTVALLVFRCRCPSSLVFPVKID